MNEHRPLLVSNDSGLVDDVLRLSAANGVEVHLAADAESARSRWQFSPLVVVGDDVAQSLSQARLPRRRDVVVVSHDPTPQTWQWAVEVGAEHVVALPDAERWLIDRLADGGEGPTRGGRVLSVMGAGGGAGASTFAATMAVVAAARSLRVLLVDADPTGGGLDVLLGVEDRPGLRWPDLVESRGRIAAGALGAALPDAQGVAVLSWGRRGAATLAPDAMDAVVDAGTRGFDLVIIDTPRHLDPVVDLVLSRSDETLLVTTGRVRSIASVASLIGPLTTRCASVSLVVRSESKTRLDDAVLDALAVPVVARLPAISAVASRADDGEPPSVRDPYGRACLAALASIATDLGGAA